MDRINFDDLVYVGFYGYGYYSDSEANTGLVIHKDDVEKVKNNFYDEWWFGELDGKHSETEGDFHQTNNKKEIIRLMSNNGFDKYGVCDGIELLKNKTFDEESDFDNFVNEIINFQEELKKYKIKKTVEYTIEFEGDDENDDN